MSNSALTIWLYLSTFLFSICVIANVWKNDEKLTERKATESVEIAADASNCWNDIESNWNKYNLKHDKNSNMGDMDELCVQCMSMYGNS